VFARKTLTQHNGFVSGVYCLPQLASGLIGRQAPVQRCLARCALAISGMRFAESKFRFS